MLDWLGDCGGLLDALIFIFEYILAPYTTYALNSKIVETLVYSVKPSSSINRFWSS